MISKEDVAVIIKQQAPEDWLDLLACLHDMPENQLTYISADDPDTVVEVVRDFYHSLPGRPSCCCLCQQ
jgi:hypothetical protein